MPSAELTWHCVWQGPCLGWTECSREKSLKKEVKQKQEAVFQQALSIRTLAEQPAFDGLADVG